MPNALFPAMAEHWGTASVGLLYAAPPLGALAAAIASRWASRVRRHGLAIAWAAALWGVSIAGFGFARPLWLALMFLAAAGAADMVSGIFRMAVWNQTIPSWIRGRTAAIEMVSYHTGTVARQRRGRVRGTSVRTSNLHRRGRDPVRGRIPCDSHAAAEVHQVRLGCEESGSANWRRHRTRRREKPARSRCDGASVCRWFSREAIVEAKEDAAPEAKNVIGTDAAAFGGVDVNRFLHCLHLACPGAAAAFDHEIESGLSDMYRPSEMTVREPSGWTSVRMMTMARPFGSGKQTLMH